MIESLADVLKFEKNTLNHVRLAKGGGGNRARELLNVLSTTQPQLKITQFSEKLNENGFITAAALLDSSNCTFFSDLGPSDLKKLSDELLNEGVTFPSIITLAESLEIDSRGIHSINRAQEAVNCYSYSNQFFKFLFRTKPEVTVGRFMQALDISEYCSLAFRIFANLIYEKACVNQ